jgi:Baseplate hub gp41
MSQQYLRQYKLDIKTQTQGPIIESDLFTLTDLRVVFQIIQNRFGAPNTARIDIYNLSEQTRATIEERFTKVTMHAGYGSVSNLKLLFKGDIRNIIHSRKSVDSVTTIFAADGNKAYEESFTNVTFSEGSKPKDQVVKIAKDFIGLITGNLDGLENAGENVLGVTYSMPTSKAMDVVSEKANVLWSIQDEEVITTPLDGPENNSLPVIELTSSTGILSTPEVTALGANVATLLNPEIKPNRLIRIKSEGQNVTIGNLFFERARRSNADGTYIVNKVTHSGDSRGNDWRSSVEGKVTRNRSI